MIGSRSSLIRQLEILLDPGGPPLLHDLEVVERAAAVHLVAEGTLLDLALVVEVAGRALLPEFRPVDRLLDQGIGPRSLGLLPGLHRRDAFAQAPADDRSDVFRLLTERV